MMYFDVPSSKMQVEQSNKVLNSSNGAFSLRFVCPHVYQNASVRLHQCLQMFCAWLQHIAELQRNT